MQRAPSAKPSENTAPARTAVFFVLFSLAPGLIYQYIQDHGRDRAVDADGLIRLALDVAPNALGSLAACSAIFVMGLGLAKNAPPIRTALFSAAIGIGGLVAWEFAQLFMPKATFDTADLIWTFVGGVAFLIAACAFFPPIAKATERRR